METIAPQPLDPGTPEPKKKPGGSPFGALIVAVLVLALGVVALALLRGKRAAPVVPPHPVATSEPTPVPTEDPALRAEAEALLDQVLTIRRELLSIGAGYWASNRWQVASRLSSEADAALGRKAYTDASGGYQESLIQYETIRADQSAAPAFLNEAALRFYEAGDAEQAVAHLEAWLVIEPEQQTARDLLPRAKRCRQTRQALDSALTAQGDGELAVALVNAERAWNLDPEFPGLREVRDAIRNQLKRDEFLSFISTGLVEMEAGNLEAAASSLSRAGALLPDDPALVDAEMQLNEKQLAVWLKAQLMEAGELESAGSFKQAYAQYLRILQRAAESAEASSGRDRVQEWMTLQARMDRHRGRWRSAETRTLVADLEQQLTRSLPTSLVTEMKTFLENYERAHTPREVRLRSDGLSSIKVQGRILEPFQEHSLELLPGSYRFTAFQKGYIDAGRILVVPMTGEIEVFDIRVLEKL